MRLPRRLNPERVGATIRVRVQPRASREGVDGERDGAWRVRVSAPPVDGNANRAVIALLARALGVRPAALAVVAGARGRDKLVRVAGLPADEIARRLAAASPVAARRATIQPAGTDPL
jgi:uncharacterized protein (TIGR00251 family)